MALKTILEARDLRLELGKKQILDGLSLDIWPGYIHAVVGPNGAGKSTLASTIMGLEGYLGFQGELLFKGESLRGLAVDERARRGISLAWQEPARFEGLTMESFLQAGSVDSSKERLEYCLDLLGLDPKQYMPRAVDKTLSGGERKRIELASIMSMKPELVLMDEPDSGIDVEALEKILDAIEYLREGSSTVLLITHSPTVLERADHAFLICCGKLIEKGSIEKIQKYFGEKCIPCDHKNAPELG